MKTGNDRTKCIEKHHRVQFVFTTVVSHSETVGAEPNPTKKMLISTSCCFKMEHAILLLFFFKEAPMAILFLHLNKQQSITQQRLQLHDICTEPPRARRNRLNPRLLFNNVNMLSELQWEELSRLIREPSSMLLKMWSFVCACFTCFEMGWTGGKKQCWWWFVAGGTEPPGADRSPSLASNNDFNAWENKKGKAVDRPIDDTQRNSALLGCCCQL